jgi:osmotically inducible lipoprotein OsmB
MKLLTRLAGIAVAGAMTMGLASAAVASEKTTNTLLGAGLGAAAGALLSEGDPLLILGSAAAGGVLGNVLTEDRKHGNSRWSDRDRRHYGNGHNNYRRASYHRNNGWQRSHSKKRHHHHRR